jgi:predicted Fe-Mo cluster-binding NifX family protein
MKIAIPIFRNRVSPRFDFSPEMWIVTVENGELLDQKRLPMVNLNLPHRLEQITSNRVDKVICGGIDALSRDQLGSRGIDVVQDVIGDADVAFDLFMRGRLRSGFCCEREGSRHFVVSRKVHLRKKR